MTYRRVIPRDLFNEGNLLKCLGRLWIETERYRCVSVEHDGEPFRIEQNSGDGSTYVANVRFRIGRRLCQLQRPLNSREPWPLYLRFNERDEEMAVFAEDGALSAEMQALLDEAATQTIGLVDL